MAIQKTELEREFYLAFLEWFKSSTVEFWSEARAPEDLAKIATKIVQRHLARTGE